MFNDLTAPRFNACKFWVDIVSNELYKQWKKESKTNRLPHGYKDFRRIWIMIAEEMKLSIEMERDGIRLPSGLGEIYFGYIRKKDRNIDYKSTEEYGKEIHHESWETSGKNIHVIYATSNRKYIHKRKRMWSFQASRKLSRIATRVARDNPLRYKDSQEKKYKIKPHDRH